VTVAASCVALLFTAACSGSTGPTTPVTAGLAVHFDSLYLQADALDRAGVYRYAMRKEMLSYLELLIAYGAAPTDVVVTTAEGVEHWKGVELQELSPVGTSLYSRYVLAAYRDADARTLLFATFDDSGAEDGAVLVTNDTLSLDLYHTESGTSFSALAGPCNTPPALLQNDWVTSYPTTACATARFTTSMAMRSQPATGVDSALTALSFSATSVSGVRIVDARPTTRRVHALWEPLQHAKRL
jgi:hypothetical protein